MRERGGREMAGMDLKFVSGVEPRGSNWRRVEGGP